MSGSMSLISTIARSSRFGRKYGPPQWMSEMWAIVKRSLRPSASPKCKRAPPGRSEAVCYACLQWPWKPRFPGISRSRAAALRQRGRARVREDPRLPRRPVAVRAADVRARGGRRRPRRRGVHARLLPPRAGLYVEVTVMKQSLVTRKNRKLRKLRERYPEIRDQALLQARPRAARAAVRPRRRFAAWPRALDDARIGEVYLDAEEIAARVARARRASIAARLRGARAGARRHAEGERRLRRRPLARDCRSSTSSTSSSSPATAAHDTGGHGADPLPEGPRRRDRAAAHVILVEEVVDTGPDAQLPRAGRSRCASRASLAACALFDRPYRRLVDDLPLRYVGFTVPDEFFVGYGFDLRRALPQPARPARSSATPSSARPRQV